MEMMKAVLLVLLATLFFSGSFGEESYMDISCSYYQKKSMQQKRVCSIKVSPICATNNVTYPNSCVYCFANIALNFTLHIRYSGKCQKPGMGHDFSSLEGTRLN